MVVVAVFPSKHFVEHTESFRRIFELIFMKQYIEYIVHIISPGIFLVSQFGLSYWWFGPPLSQVERGAKFRSRGAARGIVAVGCCRRLGRTGCPSARLPASQSFGQQEQGKRKEVEFAAKTISHYPRNSHSSAGQTRSERYFRATEYWCELVPRSNPS